ncbi:glycine cleavage system protein H [Atopobacter phocae]|uniref:glycine cleavage system protein H n=1 Tax=Atopobacter phocae TaxID=136492 RepID=UPI00046F2FAC|nr:glycine cleavage system protein H [Atopobacter phocae]
MKFSKDGFWIKEQDDHIVIGFGLKLQDDVGEVAFASFPYEEALKKGEPIIDVEASKAVTTVDSPLTGTVVKWHREVEDTPELLNAVDTELNWLVELSHVPSEELEHLLNEDPFL